MSNLAILLCAIFFTSVANACDDMAKSRHNATDTIDAMILLLNTEFSRIISLAEATDKFATATVHGRSEVFLNRFEKTFKEAKDKLPVFEEETSNNNICNRFLNDLKEKLSLEKNVVNECMKRVSEESTEYIANITEIKKSTEERLNDLRVKIYFCGYPLDADLLNSPATPEVLQCFNRLTAEAASYHKRGLIDLNDLLNAQSHVFKRVNLESTINTCVKDNRYNKFMAAAANLIKNTNECNRQQMMTNSIQ